MSCIACSMHEQVYSATDVRGSQCGPPARQLVLPDVRLHSYDLFVYMLHLWRVYETHLSGGCSLACLVIVA